MQPKQEIVNLCVIGHPDKDVPTVFDDTQQSVAFLLRASGITPLINRNRVDPNLTNILWGTGSHHSPPFEEIRRHCNAANTIIFNMEQIASDSPLAGSDYCEFLKGFRVFDYSIHNIRALRKLFPSMKAEEFPLIPSPAFSFDHPSFFSKPQYHFGFYGSINARRAQILERLKINGVRLKIITDKYGKDLAEELRECHAVLNIHAYDACVFETARALRPVSMGIPIVSEISHLPQIINWNHAPIEFIEYGELVDYCIATTKSNFNNLKSKQFRNPDFLHKYFRNPDLFESIRLLLGFN